jgi:dipeptidyl aminopeptidase/acylaminoacyl peptidase
MSASTLADSCCHRITDTHPKPLVTMAILTGCYRTSGVIMLQQCRIGWTRSAGAGGLLALTVWCLGAVDAQADDRLVRRTLPRDNLRLYLDETGQARPVVSPADWSQRRQHIVTAMTAIMGTLPGEERRSDLDMRVVEEVDEGTFVRRLITIQSEPGSRLPAYLLIPKTALAENAPRHPAVLCLHGTNNEVGHGTVVGLGKTPNRGYAKELAERGFVTLAPSYPLLANYQPDLATLGWVSGTLKAVWDNRRGLDLLDSLPYVLPRRYGVIGHSLGGHNAVYTAVFDERLVAVASSCGLDSYLDYYGGDPQRWQLEQGWCQTRYMPRLAAYQGQLEQIPFDFHELIGALAPRRVLIIAPLHDGNFKADSVDRIAQAARPIFELLGHADHLTVVHPDCGHDFPPEMREPAFQMFTDVLMPSAAPGTPGEK